MDVSSMTTPTSPHSTYAILDGSAMQGEIHRALELEPEHNCLYEGENEHLMAVSAPWLFRLIPGSTFVEWLATQPLGPTWGVLIRCQAPDPISLYKHLRNALITKDAQGREVYLRYYDPRVLQTFLPACGPEQLSAFFGPIEAFAAMDNRGQLREFRLGPAGELVMAHLDTGLTGYLQGHGKSAPQRKGPGEGKSGQPWDFGY